MSLSHTTLFKKRLQELWFGDNEIKYTIHVGKTGSGKTYQAIQRLKHAEDGVYLAPLRLLAWEIYEALNADGFSCNLVTGEEQIISERARYTSSTIEMLDYSVSHDTVVIDEAFMIGDADRGKSWLKAILTVKAKEVHIICNDEVLELLTNILTITKRKFEVVKYEALQKFSIAHEDFVIRKSMPPKGVFVTFSRIAVLIHKMKLENMEKTVSVLYGNLPPEVKKKQITDFIEGRTEYIVCTDVIGMGINLPCDYLVFLEVEKYDGKQTRRLNPIEVKQIAGRTGRYGLSSQNSFVSCVGSAKKLSFIRQQYNTESKISHAYLGLDWEMFSAFDESFTIKQRVAEFYKLKFIPSKLTEYIKKEDVNKYLELCFVIENYTVFDLQTKWYFLNAPVKRSNQQYFAGLVADYSRRFELKLPYSDVNNSDAMSLENAISELELYLNMTRNLKFNPAEKEEAKKRKDELVEKLTAVLLDKKLSTKKKCKLCTTLLSIDYPYPYCEDCYEAKVAVNYESRW